MDIRLLRFQRTAGQKGLEVIATVEYEEEEYTLNLTVAQLDWLYDNPAEAEKTINELPGVLLEDIPSQVHDESFVDALSRIGIKRREW